MAGLRSLFLDHYEAFRKRLRRRLGSDDLAMEALQDGTASTAFLRFGDSVRIEMKGRDGQSVFGAIEQEIAAVNADAAPQRARPEFAGASQGG